MISDKVKNRVREEIISILNKKGSINKNINNVASQIEYWNKYMDTYKISIEEFLSSDKRCFLEKSSYKLAMLTTLKSMGFV
jgi:hypothetical protein